MHSVSSSASPVLAVTFVLGYAFQFHSTIESLLKGALANQQVMILSCHGHPGIVLGMDRQVWLNLHS